MSFFYPQYRGGFSQGETKITSMNDDRPHTGIGLSILKQSSGFDQTITLEKETALLVMFGQMSIWLNGERHDFNRKSLFDESSQAVHACAGTQVRILAITDIELAWNEVDNTKQFKERAFHDVANEHRGKGQVGNTSYRFVRTIFDGSNSDPNTELVLGEVVTMPGRWSSYPPHHHDQAEIYHYRFTKPQGYGFAQLGEEAYVVRNNDTIKITDLKDHSQVAAPGYGMYYLWVIKHLPNNRYTVPTFTEEHQWVTKEGASFWMPEGVQ